MGKKVMKLFLDTMLRAAVIILAVAIIVMLVLLAKTIKKTGKTEEKKTEASSIVTEEQDPSDPTFGSETDGDTSEDAGQSEDETEEPDAGTDAKTARIAVINASGGDGVAASWQTTLNAAGYSSVDIGSYSGDALSSTTIYTSGSYDTSELAGLFSSPETGHRSELDTSLFDIDVSDADIVIVVGVDNIANN